ncbi:MAG: gluconate 2-dehydrogenase subunit 3 family protein [Bacteroidota bacterium]
MKFIEWSRRSFIKASASVTAGIGLGFGLVGCSNNRQNAHLRYLTPDEESLLDALTSQIIPTDEDPGAHEANVVNFIDKQLVFHYKNQQDFYRVNLSKLQQTCRGARKAVFESLPSEEQIAFMEAMEMGELPTENWTAEEQAAFFRTLVSHSMQGFYGSPRHGGNKDYVSYRMLGLAYPDIIGQNRYRNLNWRVYPD